MAQWHLRRSPHVCPRWTVNCAMRSSNMNELFRTSSLMAWVWVYWRQEFGVPLVEETQVFNLFCPCLWSLRPSAQPVAHREEKTLVSFIPLHCTPPYLIHAFRLRSFQFFVLPLPQRHSWLQPFYFFLQRWTDSKWRITSEIHLRFKNNYGNAFDFRYAIFLIFHIYI